MKNNFYQEAANIIVNVIKPYYDKTGLLPHPNQTRQVVELKLAGKINNHGVKELIKHFYETTTTQTA